MITALFVLSLVWIMLSVPMLAVRDKALATYLTHISAVLNLAMIVLCIVLFFVH